MSVKIAKSWGNMPTQTRSQNKELFLFLSSKKIITITQSLINKKHCDGSEAVTSECAVTLAWL